MGLFLYMDFGLWIMKFEKWVRMVWNFVGGLQIYKLKIGRGHGWSNYFCSKHSVSPNSNEIVDYLIKFV